jgi:hypothetical protein
LSHNIFEIFYLYRALVAKAFVTYNGGLAALPKGTIKASTPPLLTRIDSRGLRENEKNVVLVMG